MSFPGVAAPATATSSISSTSPELEFGVELPPSTSTSSSSFSSSPTSSPTMNRSGLGVGVSPECTISPLPRLSADLAGVDAVDAPLPVRAAATPPAAAAPSAALLVRSFLTGDEAEEDLRAAAAPPLPPSLSLKSLPTAEPLARLLPLPRLDLEPMLLSDRATLFNDLVGDVPRDDATDGDGMTPRMMEYEPAMEAEL